MSSNRVGRPTGRRRASSSFWIVLAIASLAALSIVSAAGAAPPSAKPVPGGAHDNFTPSALPLGVGNALTTFVVQLSGAPVTVADANSKDAGNGALTPDQKNAIKAQLKADQAPVVQKVQALGGKVLASFQSVYDGVAVQVPASQAASLESVSGVTSVYRSLNHTISNIHGVPLVQGPQTWGGTPGFTGTGMKIGDIDTGIDYTHADFGGPGTVGAWNRRSRRAPPIRRCRRFARPRR